MDHHTQINQLLQSLPSIAKNDVPVEDSCPICLVPFLDCFQEESGEDESSIGVTKLEGCGHLFCRKDLTEWVRNMHGNCPTCRHVFLDIRPPSDSDDESSDGGEYVPNEEEEEEEDAFQGSDGFTSEPDEFDIDEDIDLDVYYNWEGSGDLEMDVVEWGLTDGESEGDMSLNESEAADQDGIEVDIDISVNEGDYEALDESSDSIAPEEPK